MQTYKKFIENFSINQYLYSIGLSPKKKGNQFRINNSRIYKNKNNIFIDYVKLQNEEKEIKKEIKNKFKDYIREKRYLEELKKQFKNNFEYGKINTDILVYANNLKYIQKIAGKPEYKDIELLIKYIQNNKIPKQKSKYEGFLIINPNKIIVNDGWYHAITFLRKKFPEIEFIKANHIK